MHFVPVSNAIDSETRICKLAKFYKGDISKAIGDAVRLWAYATQCQTVIFDGLTAEQVGIAFRTYNRTYTARHVQRLVESGFLSPTDGGRYLLVAAPLPTSKGQTVDWQTYNRLVAGELSESSPRAHQELTKSSPRAHQELSDARPSKPLQTPKTVSGINNSINNSINNNNNSTKVVVENSAASNDDKNDPKTDGLTTEQIREGYRFVSHDEAIKRALRYAADCGKPIENFAGLVYRIEHTPQKVDYADLAEADKQQERQRRKLSDALRYAKDAIDFRDYDNGMMLVKAYEKLDGADPNTAAKLMNELEQIPPEVRERVRRRNARHDSAPETTAPSSPSPAPVAGLVKQLGRSMCINFDANNNLQQEQHLSALHNIQFATNVMKNANLASICISHAKEVGLSDSELAPYIASLAELSRQEREKSPEPAPQPAAGDLPDDSQSVAEALLLLDKITHQNTATQTHDAAAEGTKAQSAT